MLVIVVVFSFIPPGSWPHKRLKHVGGYAVIKLHQNTIVHLLVLIFYSFALCTEYEPYKTEDMPIGKLHFYFICSRYMSFF